MLGVVFVRRQQQLDDPLIDLRLFRVPTFSAALAINLVAFFVIFGMSIFLAQYLQSVLGLSPLAAGLWSVPEALGFVAGSLLTPRLARRYPAPVLISAGMAVGAAGYVVVATGAGLAAIVAGSTFGAVGLAAVATLVTDVAVGAAPAARAGAAAAVSETSSELGGALGLAILGSVGAAVFRAQAGPDAPATVGDAVAQGGAIADSARAAFTDALGVTAGLGAALLVSAALTSLALLRRSARGRIAPAPCP